MTKTNRSGRRRWRRLMLILALAILIWATVVLTLQRTFLFPSWIVPPPPAKVTLAPPAEIWRRDADGARIEAWFIPGQGVSDQQPGPAVIFAHGNGEVIDQWPAMLKPYLEMGISVLLVEYRGYGRSSGKPSQTAITEDFIWAYDQLIAQPMVDRSRIIFHGRSLGGGVAGSLARHRQPRAMILESTFTSVRAMARGYLIPGFMMRDPFDTQATLEAYPGPVLIYHGQADEIIPVKHAHQLAASNPHTKLVIDPPMTHNSGPSSPAMYWDAITTFLREADIVPTPPGNSPGSSPGSFRKGT